MIVWFSIELLNYGRNLKILPVFLSLPFIMPVKFKEINIRTKYAMNGARSNNKDTFLRVRFFLSEESAKLSGLQILLESTSIPSDVSSET